MACVIGVAANENESRRCVVLQSSVSIPDDELHFARSGAVLQVLAEAVIGLACPPRQVVVEPMGGTLNGISGNS